MKEAGSRGVRTPLPTQETYPHAPIVEAVLDVRVRLSSPLSEEVLTELKVREQDRYPGFRRPFQVQFKVERTNPTVEPTAGVSSQANGSAFVSKDELQIFQARPDGFSHNRLAPYLDWATFRSEAARLWGLYREIVQPQAIELLGLNYINKIAIPGGTEISDYLRAYIQIPPELPQTLEVHNFQVQMRDSDSEARIAITVAFGALDAERKVPVTLNVQAFKFVNEPALEVAENEIWDTFDHLRDLKNLAFEACITDRVREEFR
jgi:uncharacterized protein (TIGR04255 family)